MHSYYNITWFLCCDYSFLNWPVSLLKDMAFRFLEYKHMQL
jgi:hypothetical protein